MPEERIGDEGLVRELRFTTAATVVVGTVIGSGIFIGANRVAGGVDSVAGLFAVWIGAGLLTLLGALTYAEFGAMYPRSGGDFVYVNRSLGPFLGFLTGWSSFAVNLPASNAYLALAFATQVDVLKPLEHATILAPGFSERFTAIGVLALFTLINYFGVRQGGATQRLLTFAKVGLMLGLVVVALASPKSDPGNLVPFFEATKSASGSLAGAFIAALFAYDGWNAVSRVAGEVRNPQRVLPRALATGVLTVIAIYVLVNLAYVVSLGLEGMQVDRPTEVAPVGSVAAQRLLGSVGELVLAGIVGISILGSINGITLSGPRIYFAMARERLFFPALARVHRIHRTPHVSIIVQQTIAALLILLLPFTVLQNYVVVAAWLAYALTGIGLIVQRRKHPEIPRPFKVPFYPVVPFAFVILALAFIGYLFVDSLPVFNEGSLEPLTYFLINIVALAVGGLVYVGVRRRYGRPGPGPVNSA